MSVCQIIFQIIALLSALLRKTQSVSDDEGRCRAIRFGSDGPERIFLVVSPGSVMFNWEDELKTWGRFCVEKYHG